MNHESTDLRLEGGILQLVGQLFNSFPCRSFPDKGKKRILGWLLVLRHLGLAGCLFAVSGDFVLVLTKEIFIVVRIVDVR